MKKLITSLLIAINSLIGFAQESGKNFIDQNFIEVSGYADKEIAPNRIYLNIVINEKNTKGQSLSEIEKLMMDKLREIGIDVTRDLTIKNFISNFQYYAIFKSDIIFIKEYELQLYEAEKVGKVFVELEKLGISNISIDRLDHDEIEKYKQEIKIEAIKAAKEKATALTFAIDQEIGRALYISEDLKSFNVSNNLHGQASGLYIRGLSSKKVYGSSISEIDVEFEKIKIEYNIVVRFELK